MSEKTLKISEIIGGGYNEFWKCKKRYRVVKGSRGSKKSKTSALFYVTKMMQHPAANLLIVRRTYRTLKDSCYSDLKWAIKKLGVESYWNCTLSPLEITYIPTGQKILFRGMDDGLKITSISVPVGVLCWVWCEECFEITSEDDFNKLDMSIRGEVPDGLWKQITLTFNPWSSLTWIKPRFFDNPDDNTFTLTTTYQCNEWLDDADRHLFELMKVNNPRRYSIEGEGNWGISEGLIYDKFKFEDFNLEEIKKIKNAKSSFSLDFGFTDPSAFICSILDEANKKIYVFDEFYKTGMTNQELAEQIKLMGYGGQRIICDSAEPKSIQELCNLGIKAEPGRKGSDSVNHGIQLLQNYEFIISTCCPEFYKEISNYCWKKDKFDKPTDTPEHEFSHGMDSIRYGITKISIGDSISFD